MTTAYNIILRELQITDLDDYIKLNHPDREFHEYDGPYNHHKSEEELKLFVEELKTKYIKDGQRILPNSRLIIDSNTNTILGQVNWYWKSIETFWLEVGIVLYDSDVWGHGVGRCALTKWIDEVFQIHPQLIRIGLSTWSGNLRMIRLAEKLGLKREACYKKARIINGIHYDSVSYGILKEEWECSY